MNKKGRAKGGLDTSKKKHDPSFREIFYKRNKNHLFCGGSSGKHSMEYLLNKKKRINFLNSCKGCGKRVEGYQTGLKLHTVHFFAMMTGKHQKMMNI